MRDETADATQPLAVEVGLEGAVEREGASALSAAAAEVVVDREMSFVPNRAHRAPAALLHCCYCCTSMKLVRSSSLPEASVAPFVL